MIPLATYDGDGLKIPSNQNDIISFIASEFIRIYGLPQDKVFNSNEPDAQLIQLFSLIAFEYYQISLGIFNAFDLDSAIGSDLDRVGKLVNAFIQRKGGQFTTQNIEIVLDRTTTLNGLDPANYYNLDGVAYTVQDTSGQQFLLANSTTLNAGTHTLVFRAKTYGQILTTPNTITEPVDIVAGVVSVNNPTSQTTIGRDEETDNEFRVRLKKSHGMQGTSSVQNVFSRLSSIDNVSDVKIEENDTPFTNITNNIPANTIWAIVEGGLDLDVAKAIFDKLSAGCGTKGNVEINVPKLDGTTKVVRFDRPITQNLYIRFAIKRSKVNQNFNITNIKNHILTNAKYGIGQAVESSALIQIATEGLNLNGGGGYIVNLEVSKDNINWSEYIDTDTIQYKYVLSALNIIILILP